MKEETMRKFAIFILGTLLSTAAFADGQLRSLPDPAQNIPLAKASTQQTAVFAGGCFWGVQLVFQHVKGVVSAISGYAGGAADTAHYKIVSTGTTGHAESVQVVYDPSRVSYGQLLKIYFAVAHNPTELNYQGPDEGTQYRSEIFTTNAEQQRIAQAYIAQLDAAQVYPQRIVTRVAALPAFYPAEHYHQNFATLHPYYPYIYINDRPKLEHLKEQFPQMYK
jgi:peptide-methionine (S)-S-oxide reductase